MKLHSLIDKELFISSKQEENFALNWLDQDWKCFGKNMRLEIYWKKAVEGNVLYK